jgi:hypothetical protein
MNLNEAKGWQMRTPIPKGGIPPKEFMDETKARIGKGIEQLLIVANAKK